MLLQVKREHKFAVIILVILAVVNIARGLFHYLSPDSGSHIVAGMDYSGNVIYLLAIIGAIQFCNGLLFLYIAIKQRQLVLAALCYELLVSALVLPLNFCFKQPVTPVPGRFANIAEFVVVLVTICLVIYFERRNAKLGQG
jgi:hypothetical protein